MKYCISIRDTRTGKQLHAYDGLASPYDAGRTAAGAWAELIFRDGHDPADLDLEGVAVDEGEGRPLTPAEESAMVSALDQWMAEHA